MTPADLANEVVSTNPTGRQEGCGVVSLNTLGSRTFIVETIQVDGLADNGEISTAHRCENQSRPPRFGPSHSASMSASI